MKYNGYYVKSSKEVYLRLKELGYIDGNWADPEDNELISITGGKLFIYGQGAAYKGEYTEMFYENKEFISSNGIFYEN